MRHRHLLVAAFGSAVFAACGGGQAGRPPGGDGSAPTAQPGDAATERIERDVARVREATADFRDLEAAAAAGYAREVPRCVSHPQHGGMGFHHVNPRLLDARLEVDRPEILVYGRAADGTYRLNGVEYVVPYTARPRDASPPTVMGQPLHRSDELGLWYLHVWVWNENPAGLFASWHPGVKCP